MTPGSRFCPACGTSLGGSGANLTRYAPWILAAATAVVLAVLVLRPTPVAAPATPEPSSGAEAAGTPPDLSAMSPAERFNRLYQRIITAAQTGDQATVTRFMPMAIGAFAMLDSVTVDARYHLAMLHLHVGDLPAAAAQADTVKRTDADHLFGYVISAAVARWQKDDPARDADYRRILDRFDAEMAKALPEYLEHRAMLEELRKTASGTKQPSPGA